MAIEITKDAKPEPFIADRYLYLNADKTKVVEEGDPAARFVLAGPGSTIPDDEVKKYGLDKVKKKAAKEVEGGKTVGSKPPVPETGKPEPEPEQVSDEPEPPAPVPGKPKTK